MTTVPETPELLTLSQTQNDTDAKDLTTTDEKSVHLASPPPEHEDYGVDKRAERALVWRLDLIFLLVGFLGYIFKYLDQTNIVSLLECSAIAR